SCTYVPDTRKVSFPSLRELRRILNRDRIDVVHVHFHRDVWTASLALRHDTRTRLFVGIYMGVIPKNDLLHRWIYKRVDGFFTSSPELERRLPSLYPVGREKVHLLPYGRSLGMYRRDDARRRSVREE